MSRILFLVPFRFTLSAFLLSPSDTDTVQALWYLTSLLKTLFRRFDRSLLFFPLGLTFIPLSLSNLTFLVRH